MFRKRHLLLLMLGLILACSGKPSGTADTGHTISLEGEWQILPETVVTDEVTALDDSAWDRITLPGNLSRYLITKTGKADGMLMIRKKVHIPEAARGAIQGISLGRIANADLTSFNGVRIGSLGKLPPRPKSMWNFPRYYPLPESLIRYGETNVITIKVWVHIYGEVKGSLYMANADTWNTRWGSDFFWRVMIHVLMIAMGIPLLFLFIVFYIKRPDSSEYLWYSLQLACGFYILFDLCTFWNAPPDITIRFKLVGISWVALNVAHPIFLHRFYSLNRRYTEIVLASYMVVICGSGIFIESSTMLRSYGILLIVLTSAIGFYNLSCHITALYLKRPYAKLFSVFGITVIIGAIHDGINYFSKFSAIDLDVFGYSFDMMVFPISAAALYMGTAILMVYRYIELQNRNEELKKTLEIKVEERTRSLIRMTEELERKNIQLADIAIRDSLTGLYNHAALHERLDDIVMASNSQQFPVCVVMMDVDDFKRFNDVYGHQAGDEVLVAISTVLKHCIREYDVIKKYVESPSADTRNYDLAGRYGGDEFVLVLPYCDTRTAETIVQRIAKTLSDIRLACDPDARIRTSYGIAFLPEKHHCHASNQLIHLADTALYASKTTQKGSMVSMIYKEPDT